LAKTIERSLQSAAVLLERLPINQGQRLYAAVWRHGLSSQQVLVDRMDALNVLADVQQSLGANLSTELEHHFDQVRSGVNACQSCEYMAELSKHEPATRPLNSHDRPGK
jgi:hypothetical protein